MKVEKNSESSRIENTSFGQKKGEEEGGRGYGKGS